MFLVSTNVPPRQKFIHSEKEMLIFSTSPFALLLIYSQFLLEGLTVLKNRGYDSAGMATIGDTPTKDIVSIIRRSSKFSNNSVSRY